MKFTVRLFIFLLIATTFGCGKKTDDHQPPSEEVSSLKEWKEMDEFHMVMAEAFHPYKDSADLKPAKELASELALAAEVWKDSSVPEGLEKDQVESKLADLAKLSDEFSDQIASLSDEEIANRLTALHDLFHELQNDFYAGASGEHHDDEHHHH